MTDQPEILQHYPVQAEPTRLTLPIDFHSPVVGPQIKYNISQSLKTNGLTEYNLLDFVLMPRKIIDRLKAQGYAFSDIVKEAKPVVGQLVGATAILGSLHVRGKRDGFLLTELEEDSANKFTIVAQELYDCFSLRLTPGNTRPHIVLGRTENRKDAWSAMRDLTKYEPSILGSKIIYGKILELSN